MLTLGISAYYHDSAAALVRDGRPVAAAQEERFSRRKHDASFPHRAVDACLQRAGATLPDVDRVVFHEKPLRTFERLLETWLAFAPRGFPAFAAALPRWMRGKLFLKTQLLEALDQHGRFDASRLHFAAHHHSHAAAAFYPSPFDEALVLTVDGVGEWETTTWGIGSGTSLALQQAVHFPHSLGLLYSAFTATCGFRVNSGEYKLMGLAPYGTPQYADRIREHLIEVGPDGAYRLDLRYFDWCTGLQMTRPAFHELFGPAHPVDAPPTQHQMDLAASVQEVLEDVLVAIVRHGTAQTGLRSLCLAGGVALNCVANRRLLDEVDALWVQPAAGDAGGALGAALIGAVAAGADRVLDTMAGAGWGPTFDDERIAATLEERGVRFEAPEDVDGVVVDALEAGQVVAWFQGPMEFGPRALGHRSILADPRRADMKDRINAQVKHREGFRPFAPAVLAEHASDCFEPGVGSPYMTVTARVQPHAGLPAVTHVDGSARVQTVEVERQPRLHALLERWYARTGCPALLNTSFNVRGEPIVCTPADAWACFRSTGLDLMAIGSYVVRRADQDPTLLESPRAHLVD